MPSSSVIQSAKVAIYFDLVSGRSAREIAKRFSISHPTATKYAAEALASLKQLPFVVAHPELAVFLDRPIKKQSLGLTPATREMLEAVLRPYLDDAAAAISPAAEPTLIISCRVPESVFYRFQRIVKVTGEERGTELTISSLGGELITSFVESGVPPVSQAQFKQADALMDEMRQLLAKYGITNA